MNKKIAVYPGSFDPITYGHMDIIERSLKIFDKVIIGILQNSEKKHLFNVNERYDIIKQIYNNNKQVEIKIFDGLLVEFVKKNQSKIIIRGLRAISDFDYELQLALTNRKLNNEIETIFLMPKGNYIYLSSSIVKEIAKLNGKIDNMVDTVVVKKLKEKFGF